MALAKLIVAFVCSNLVSVDASRVRRETGKAESRFYFAERHRELWQCDRQCRWRHGFFNRQIVGVGTKSWFLGPVKCKCWLWTSNGRTALDGGNAVLPEFTKWPFDSRETWSGDFTSPWVCASAADGGQETLTRSAALWQNREILHCGKCAACSAKDDIVVLSLTRKWITEVMTKESAAFLAPAVGHHDPGRFKQALITHGINFSTSRPDGRRDLPTCMDCWVDNVMQTRRSCTAECWTKFIDAGNPGADITNCGALDFACQCLKCDEDYAGPAFIKCAGANRRSTGIVSDIQRPSNQQCTVGLYHGVRDEDLPTAPKP